MGPPNTDIVSMSPLGVITAARMAMSTMAWRR
jgi:hypothetical protein